MFLNSELLQEKVPLRALTTQIYDPMEQGHPGSTQPVVFSSLSQIFRIFVIYAKLCVSGCSSRFQFSIL